MSFIFDTERLLVRKLILEDIAAFHEMHGNINVMRYVRGRSMTFEEDKKDLKSLIKKYDTLQNDYWIYAIERTLDSNFIGSVAFVKDVDNNNEIGYRFLERYWKNGYGTEIVKGMINYSKQKGFNSLIAYVAYENIASDNIIKNAGFEYIEDSFCEAAKVKERKYRLEL